MSIAAEQRSGDIGGFRRAPVSGAKQNGHAESDRATCMGSTRCPLPASSADCGENEGEECEGADRNCGKRSDKQESRRNQRGNQNKQTRNFSEEKVSATPGERPPPYCGLWPQLICRSPLGRLQKRRLRPWWRRCRSSDVAGERPVPREQRCQALEVVEATAPEESVYFSIESAVRFNYIRWHREGVVQVGEV